jgi:hypothetical protein
MAWTQLDFLEFELSKGEGKYIIESHIEPGINWFGSNYWNGEYVDRLEEILLVHKDKILFGLSAHDHLGALRSFKDDNGEYLMQLLITPSITMADGN